MTPTSYKDLNSITLKKGDHIVLEGKRVEVSQLTQASHRLLKDTPLVYTKPV